MKPLEPECGGFRVPKGRPKTHHRLAAVQHQPPTTGPLIHKISATCDNARFAEFYRRCKLLGIKGISLHSYRYAWAGRAKTCGYPERFAQAALGHNSQAVHRAYARKALVLIPTLEEYEAKAEAAGTAPQILQATA